MPEPSDDRRGEAILRAYTGEGLTAIADGLGVNESEIQTWLADAAARVVPDHLPSRVMSNQERGLSAERLLTAKSFIRVLQPEHEDEEADLLVYFNDIAAHEFFDLVEASVDVVSAFPGVQSARHEDRELIVVHGRADPVPLQEHLLRWWEAQLEALVEGRNR